MLDGRCAGTMCLTEPHAGSDVGATKTTRARRLDGTLHHPRHQVLHLGRRPRPRREHHPPRARAHRGRARRAPRASRSSSCPRSGSTPTARLGEPNDVATASIEHKMGINGSATAVLNFGENGALPRRARRRPAAPGHAADVPDDERRAHRGRRAGRRRRLDRVPERARVRARAQAGLVGQALQGPERAARADHRARRRPPHAARDEGQGRGHARARGASSPSTPTWRARSPRRDDGEGRATTRARSTCSRRSSRPTAPTRRSASPRWPSRPTAAPAT